VQLGVYCDLGKGEVAYFDDLLSECGDEHNQFDFLVESERFTCYETATFPSGSNASQTQTVPLLAITTDPNWVTNPETSCYQKKKNTFTYRANYTAQFQYLRDGRCDGPAPVIQVYCNGPTSIQLLTTSDSSILCSTPVVLRIDGRLVSMIECNNTCASDAACQEVYLNLGGQDIEAGPFGEIFFLCDGDDLDSIVAGVSFLDNGNGTCAGSSSSVDTRNFHVARMGVSCPTDFGDRAYDFDDFYFDCVGLGTPFPSDGNPGNVYTCYYGENCNGIACQVDFFPVLITSSVENLMDKCVESAVPITPAPAPVPNTTVQLFNFSAKFEASWGLLFDPVSGLACSGDTPTVRMTCINSTITFVNSTYETVNCTAMSTGVMECTDNSTNFVNNFTGVEYVSGDVLCWL
jgi:hypothetical protein